MYRACCTAYYPDQQMLSMYINNVSVLLHYLQGV